MNRVTTSAYLDWISSAPILPEVIEAIIESMRRDFANPSSRLHPYGVQAQRTLNAARNQVAHLISAYDPIEITFTSTTTEANHLAIRGIADVDERGKRILISSIEHPSIKKTAETLIKKGFFIEEIPVDEFGIISLDAFKEQINHNTTMVAVQLANTEIGTIQPIHQISEICKEFEVPLHCDGWGFVGIMPTNVRELGCTSLSFGSNGFWGPIGAAALWVDKSIETTPQLLGGVQENRRRAGTENVTAIVGMAEAAKIAIREGISRSEMLAQKTSFLKKQLDFKIDSNFQNYFHFTGDHQNRLPQLLSFRFEWVEGEALLLEIGQKNVAAISGTACIQPETGASYVLSACGVQNEQLSGGITVSVGWSTTEEEMNYATDCISESAKRLLKMSPMFSYGTE